MAIGIGPTKRVVRARAGIHDPGVLGVLGDVRTQVAQPVGSIAACSCLSGG